MGSFVIFCNGKLEYEHLLKLFFMDRFDGKDLVFFRTQNWQICFAKLQVNFYQQPVHLVGNIKHQRASKSGLLNKYF